MLSNLSASASSSSSPVTTSNPSSISPANRSSILCRLSLTVIEVRRYSDYSIIDLLSKVGFSNFFHLCSSQKLPQETNAQSLYWHSPPYPIRGTCFFQPQCKSLHGWFPSQSLQEG